VGLPARPATRAPRYPDVSDYTGAAPAPRPTVRTTARPARTGVRPPERHVDGPGRRRAATTPAGPAAPATGPAALRGRVAAAAVAVGALATAGHSLVDLSGDAGTTELAAGALSLVSAGSASSAAAEAPGPRAGTGIDAATANVLAVPASTDEGSGHVSSLAKGQQRAEQAAARAAAARAPQFVKPAQGTFTSGFGSRWGSTHKGVDIAGPIGTPIVSVAEGVVTAAGPASGFGQWVKVRLDDGTETVYGHVNRFFVSEGEHVKAGQEIAEIGNRGQSTGPHLHFEVHTPGGTKINPLPWLAERGISLGAEKD
jgi:biotin carboxyl carrier protein